MQLTNLENLIFNPAKDYTVKNSKIKYQRIKIETNYSDGKKGELVIETPYLFSFGVNERLNQETNQLACYSVPVCLWGKKMARQTLGKTYFLKERIIYLIFVKTIWKKNTALT